MKTITPAKLGSISTGTLRTEDLLAAFSSELEWQIRRNGEYFANPANFPLRDTLNALVGQAQDAYAENGADLEDEESAAEIVNEIQDALSEHFAGAYRYFGTLDGDGADFGFWPDHGAIVELPAVETVKAGLALSSHDYSTDFRIVNDHGNTTVYGADGSVILEIV